MSAASSHRGRLAVALVLALAGALVWMPRQFHLSQQRREMAQALAQYTNLTLQIADQTRELETCRAEAAKQSQIHVQTSVSAAKAERQLAAANPDAYWAQPPVNWPVWETNSPYLWLRKETLASLPIKRISKDGRITSDIAEVMSIPQKQLDSINTSLAKALSDAGAALASNAHRTVETNKDGERVVSVAIDSIPELTQPLTNQFETALVGTLGRQRGEALMGAAQSLIQETTGFGAQSCLYSARSMTNGFVEVRKVSSYQGGHKQSSSGRVRANGAQPSTIPEYLYPFFQDVFNVPAASP